MIGLTLVFAREKLEKTRKFQVEDRRDTISFPSQSTSFRVIGVFRGLKKL
jgi:hypothetical protein